MKLLAALGSAAAIMVAVAPPSSAAIVTNESVPNPLSVFVPCANDGAGEVVDLDGNLHILVASTVNGDHFAAVVHFQPQGISGFGETTGDKYQATGITTETTTGSLVNGQFSDTFVNNFRIIGEGAGNNFLVHENVHVTFNADGTFTVFIDNASVECI